MKARLVTRRVAFRTLQGSYSHLHSAPFDTRARNIMASYATLTTPPRKAAPRAAPCSWKAPVLADDGLQAYEAFVELGLTRRPYCLPEQRAQLQARNAAFRGDRERRADLAVESLAMMEDVRFLEAHGVATDVREVLGTGGAPARGRDAERKRRWHSKLVAAGVVKSDRGLYQAWVRREAGQLRRQLKAARLAAKPRSPPATGGTSGPPVNVAAASGPAAPATGLVPPAPAVRIGRDLLVPPIVATSIASIMGDPSMADYIVTSDPAVLKKYQCGSTTLRTGSACLTKSQRRMAVQYFCDYADVIEANRDIFLKDRRRQEAANEEEYRRRQSCLTVAHLPSFVASTSDSGVSSGSPPPAAAEDAMPEDERPQPPPPKRWRGLHILSMIMSGEDMKLLEETGYTPTSVALPPEPGDAGPRATAAHAPVSVSGKRASGRSTRARAFPSGRNSTGTGTAVLPAAFGSFAAAGRSPGSGRNLSLHHWWGGK